MVVFGGRIGQRQRLVLGQEVERVVGNAVGPGHRAVVGVARHRGDGKRRLDRTLLKWRQRQRGYVVGGEVAVVEQGAVTVGRSVKSTSVKLTVPPAVSLPGLFVPGCSARLLLVACVITG